ncbi:MAG: putative methyltransferase [Candidatus Saccharibacteria bacterium]|nr:putative methyltransferase [Candidatus Saccharibacteria bacterium]
MQKNTDIQDVTHEVTIEKLVHGGQGLGTLPDGRRVFVWNALPGETVQVRIIKAKRSYAEAIAEQITKPSAERIAPQEENYLSTSPWQIMSFAAENQHKKAIVEELFGHEKVVLPAMPETIHGDQEWQYRNKMEYSFWGDDEGLHLALHQRGSHGKQIVSGSKLALPAIDAAANAIAKQLSDLNTRAGDLKTIMVRTSENGKAVGALFTKLPKFSQLTLPPELKGLRVYHSNPKSPASVPTQLLYELGDTTLSDKILDATLSYDPIGFFQANLPVFRRVVERINSVIDTKNDVIDFYSGVGSIGLSVKGTTALVETDAAAVAMARQNVGDQDIKVVEATAETALDYITPGCTLIVDPPRAGLHHKVVSQILATRPSQLIYLSCNPATQARDLALLQASYSIELFEVYNFFPKTPHIETLAVLKLK